MRREQLVIGVLSLLLLVELVGAVKLFRKTSCLKKLYVRQRKVVARKQLLLRELEQLRRFVDEGRRLEGEPSGGYSELLLLVDGISRLDGVSSVKVQPVPLYRGDRSSGSYLIRVRLSGWSSLANLLNFVLERPLMCSLGKVSYDKKGKIEADLKVLLEG